MEQYNNNDEADALLDEELIKHNDIERIIFDANEEALKSEKFNNAIAEINLSLSKGDEDKFLAALRNPVLSLSPVYDFAGLLYLQEFRNIWELNGEADFT